MRDTNLFYRNSLAALERRIILVIRQSTVQQVSAHVGSAEVQKDQMRYLRRVGVDDVDVEIADLRGKSGRPGIHRPLFEQLLAEVRSGEVGLIVLARHDRLGRDDEDSIRLFRAMEENGTLCMVDGRLYDPREPGDDLNLRMHAAFAAYENKARNRWMVLTRIAKVRNGELLIPLPSCLVWADPTDPTFKQRMRAAGLEAQLARTDEHEVWARGEEGRQYVFPFPDRDVYLSAKLRMEWALETQSITKVVERILEGHGDWPARHRGQIPIFDTWIWDRQLAPTWRSLDEPGYDGRAAVRKWLRSPALYNTYKYTSDAVSGPGEPPEEIVTWKGAFPTFGRPADRERVIRVCDNSIKEWNRGSYSGPRNHVFENVRCDYVLEDGTSCGYVKNAVYPEGDYYQYLSGHCHHRGHPDSINRCIDDAVLTILRDVLDSERLEAAVKNVRVRKSAILDRRRRLTRRVDRLERRIKTYREAEADAREDGRRQDIIGFQDDRAECRQQLQDARAQLEQYRQDEEEIREAERRDLDRIRDLAADFRSLLDRAQRLEAAEEKRWNDRDDEPDDRDDGGEETFAAEGLVRRIVAELIDRVYVHRCARWSYRVTVKFPTGLEVSRICFAQQTPCTQPQRLWASQRLRAGEDPESVVRLFDSLPPTVVRDRTDWAPERVRAAALIHEHDESVSPRDGEALSIPDLADAIAAEPNKVLKNALCGFYGPAEYGEETLLVSPTDEELHKRHPEFAREAVAAEAGWAVQDTVTLADLRSETGRSTNWINNRVEYGSGRRRDAIGRIYVRRSDMEVTYEDFIDDALEQERHKDLRDFDRQHWTSLVEARTRLGCHVTEVNEHAPRLELPSGAPTRRPVAVWIGPEVEETLTS